MSNNENIIIEILDNTLGALGEFILGLFENEDNSDNLGGSEPSGAPSRQTSPTIIRQPSTSSGGSAERSNVRAPGENELGSLRIFFNSGGWVKSKKNSLYINSHAEWEEAVFAINGESYPPPMFPRAGTGKDPLVHFFLYALEDIQRHLSVPNASVANYLSAIRTTPAPGETMNVALLHAFDTAKKVILRNNSILPGKIPSVEHINPDRFGAHNINNLPSGKYLLIPTLVSKGVVQADGFKYVYKISVENWNDFQSFFKAGFAGKLKSEVVKFTTKFEPLRHARWIVVEPGTRTEVKQNLTWGYSVDQAVDLNNFEEGVMNSANWTLDYVGDVVEAFNPFG